MDKTSLHQEEPRSSQYNLKLRYRRLRVLEAWNGIVFKSPWEGATQKSDSPVELAMQELADAMAMTGRSMAKPRTPRPTTRCYRSQCGNIPRTRSQLWSDLLVPGVHRDLAHAKHSSFVGSIQLSDPRAGYHIKLKRWNTHALLVNFRAGGNLHPTRFTWPDLLASLWPRTWPMQAIGHAF